MSEWPVDDEFDHAERGRSLYRQLTTEERIDHLPAMRRDAASYHRSVRTWALAFIEMADKDLRGRGPYRSPIVPCG